ncbi:ImmA/IrrE family metallo-endopeptidase [Sporosarcina sp. GW1-11]|uniref:ImmA/IrrE family metallo-endopeptidase n=1 Tax=Sporosarcina sp. GW1-11 TaxID=2899126 RepID=UPI00294F11F0|nr:ImmA/IrrE family metallo-endopeptidase [Sporosarcina sp. GW1-11]MDV6377715.1 ImmA/IrrE family metallo-endopeptidase [Sporosarcina sp. GW1-11]
MPYIKKKIEALTKKYKTNCPFQLAQSKGILVQYADLGETLGFYFQSNRIQIININYNLQQHEQRFVCAHELGHAVLHSKANAPFMKKNTFLSVDRLEVEANRFAVELLLPDEVFYEHKDSSMTVQEIAAMYCVPGEIAHLKKMDPHGLDDRVCFYR